MASKTLPKDNTVKTAKPPRKTQAERSAATRKILLDAAIKCLFEHGYGTTTTILVAEMAGVSRGAMLHQFPSKADLMSFVVEAVFEDEVRQYGKLLKGIDDPRERLLAYPMAVWKLHSRPAGVAVMEIFQGSRSDHALARKLKQTQAKIDKFAVASLESEFPHGVSIPLLQLIVGVARGLAVSQLIAPTARSAKEPMELFQDLLRAGMEAHLLRADTKGKKK
ncbi:TetR/AcrR family transcriptional regulator [Sphingopyxis sp.]|jgi:AcrR family transcriptional regulator|uniref:TetR/AcrR family transcriptional regulator n=1 Tax=Sphingopyxis sp. TaxID=1908224 RepID=UPI002DEF543C|nr:TetR/AcrR family transcriptional regulator [Sphingopyxis sp.]